MLLLESRDVGESGVFLQYIPLRWDSPYAGPLGGGGSDSKIALFGAWQTLSVRRVMCIQYLRLSTRTDV